MPGYLAIAAIWIFFAVLVCVFIHGAKKAKRSMKAIDEARQSIKWPAPHTEETRNT